MARGWESKSVADQIEMSDHRGRRAMKRAMPAQPATVSVVESIRKRENMRLSVTRVTQELQTAQNPRYRALLEKSLADLELQLAQL